MAKDKKLSLEFVNGGKSFELKNWTTLKHKEVLAEVAKFEDKLDEKSLDEKYRTLLILKGLHEIDPSVKEEDIAGMHPDDKLALFAAVYLKGKKGIFAEDENFRKKGKSKK